MNMKKTVNLNFFKLFVLVLGVVILFNYQTSKSEAATTLVGDHDLQIQLNGEINNGMFVSRALRLVDVHNSNTYFTKRIGETEFTGVYEGTYDVYDLTAHGTDSSAHTNLTPITQITVVNRTTQTNPVVLDYSNHITTLTIDTDIQMHVDGKVKTGELIHKTIRFADANYPNIYYTKRTGGTKVKLLEGTYDVYDLTAHGTDSSAHTDLTPIAQITVDGTTTDSPFVLNFNKKYAILVVAGQSNAVGYDESPVHSNDELYQENSRIKQLGLFEDDNLEIIPLTYSAQNFQNMSRFGNDANPNQLGTKGIHLPLGNLILPYIPADYELLIIPAAYGGTGFTTTAEYGVYDEANKKPTNISNELRWGVDSAYYKTIKARVEHVLNLNPENYYMGTIWCQGEHDGTNPQGHKVAFEEMTNDFFTYFNENYPNRVGIDGKATWSKDQWFIYETVPYWTTIGRAASAAGVKEIFANYKTWSPATYVTIDFGSQSAEYTNETNGTGRTSSERASHYGNNAYSNLVAPAVFKKMLDAGVIR